MVQCLYRRYAAMQRLCCICLVVAGQLVFSGISEAFPAQYADALKRTRYEVYNGNVNSDGHTDIFLDALPSIAVFANGETFLPLQIPAVSPAFALISRANGDYRLVVEPAAHIRDGVEWNGGNFSLSFGDTGNDGSDEMLIDARFPWGPSFLLSTSPADGTPVVAQLMDAVALGLELGAPQTSASFEDVNGDARADLVVRERGVVTSVLVADADGRFAAAREANRPAATRYVWTEFRESLAANDVSSALDYISVDSVAKYSRALEQVDDLSGILAGLSELRPLSISADYAEYMVTQTIDGQRLAYIVVFSYEDGRWVLKDF